jgi:putative ABC transport system permease protein
MRLYLSFIKFIGLIVPRRLRADWRQEWEAELQYRELLLADWDKLDLRHKLDLTRRSLGAFWDALLLQPRRLEDEMFQDIRFGLRMLGKSAGFTLVAVFTLALGVGATTAIFSAVNPILFESLPYPQPRSIVSLWDFANDGSPLAVTFGNYRELAERSRSLEELSVFRTWQPTMIGVDQPERLEGQRVTASYFRVLGVAPAIGQEFQESDDNPNGPRIAIISDSLWKRRFSSDQAIIGREITLDANPYTVVGVMPSNFESVLAPSADIWAPLQYDKLLLPDSREWGHHLKMIGRLRAGVSIDLARQEISSIGQAPIPEFPRPGHSALQQGLIVRSLQDDVTGKVKPALLAVLGAVVLVLAIACVNVTNLLLARAAQRRGEFAVRAALGAMRTRLVRQLLTESLLLAILGGAMGMVVALAGVRGVVALSPPGLPRLNAIQLDGAVFGFALAVTTVVGIVVGLSPAWYVARGELQVELQQSSRRTAGGSHFTRRALVVAEVGFALMLLVNAGLLLRSLQQLFAIHPGFDSSHLLTMNVQTSGRRFDQAATNRFFADALEAVRKVPGVNQAAFTSQLPLSGDGDDGYGVHFESSPTGNPEADNGALRYAVSPGYVEAMGIPLRGGRLLDEHDTSNAPHAVLISESLANSKFPGQDPIGQRLRIGPNDSPWNTVVGVVGNVRQSSLVESLTDAVYITNEQWSMFDDSARWLVVRSGGDAASLATAVKQAVWSVDKDQPILRIATMDTLLAKSAGQRRFAMILFEVFGAIALVLAGTGIYGVLSGSVTERVREIGIRAALGASPARILALVLRQGITLTFVGIVIGVSGAAAASRALISLLFGVSSLDPVTYIGVVVLLFAVSILACWIPAWRAAKVDPAITLRGE